MRWLLSPFLAAALMGSASAAPITFNNTDAYQSYTVPSGVTDILFDLLGASGGNGSGNYNVYGGAGARVKGSLSVTPGDILYIFVGGVGQNSGTGGSGGFNGGGSGFGTFGGNGGGGGGGATDIRINSTSFSSVVAIAGGGGGANGWGGYGGFGANVGSYNTAFSGYSAPFQQVGLFTGAFLQGGNAGPAAGGVTTSFAGGGGGYYGGYQGGITIGTGFLSSGHGGSSWFDSNVVSSVSITDLGTTAGGNFGSFSTSGLDGVAYLTMVPEPSTYALFGIASLALLIANRRKIS
jgi:hypothetical protein